MNEVFYEVTQSKSSEDLSSEIKTELILHFLSKVEEFIVLFETKVILSKTTNSDSKECQELINEFQKILSQVDSSITLVKGKIREIYLSYSS
ncbi:MAG: hypothetical protein EU532_06675 [Promethearchaeota archaeon]|nr:MAG: hypothetical protein EU532_06675 [Candidatus Lokiarchaeota archaeon]